MMSHHPVTGLKKIKKNKKLYLFLIKNLKYFLF
jgi:hypothetical protein